MSSNLGWDWRRLERARWNIVDYGYTLGEKIANPDIITDNSQPIIEWIQTRKAAIAEARTREPDPAKRSAILPESLFLLELAETLITIASNYAEQIKKTTTSRMAEIRGAGQTDEKQSIHDSMAYGL